MTDYLKGNYELNAQITEPAAAKDAKSTEEFERKALARLGGSVCFVSKKGFVWKGETKGGART